MQLRVRERVGYDAALHLARAGHQVIPSMRTRVCGTIINISSVGGRITTGASAAYASSKHALDGFSQSLAQERYPFGVKVFVVAPGIIHTPIGDYGAATAKP